MTIWHELYVPRSDYRHVRRLGAVPNGHKTILWVNATQFRSAAFKLWREPGGQSRSFTVFVDYHEHDRAKRDGAFWVPDAKCWRFDTKRPDCHIPDYIQKQRTPPPRTYLDMPFRIKDEAKRCGCTWDPVKRKWFIHSIAALSPELLRCSGISCAPQHV